MLCIFSYWFYYYKLKYTFIIFSTLYYNLIYSFKGYLSTYIVNINTHLKKCTHLSGRVYYTCYLTYEIKIQNISIYLTCFFIKKKIVQYDVRSKIIENIV